MIAKGIPVKMGEEGVIEIRVFWGNSVTAV